MIPHLGNQLRAGRSHEAASGTIQGYDQTAHATNEQIEAKSGQQIGSPDLLAKGIVKLSRTANPPLHFLAGENSVDRALAELPVKKTILRRGKSSQPV